MKKMMTTNAAQAASATGVEHGFRLLAGALDGALLAGEHYTAWFEAETTDFVRMNRGKVRQPGSVSQRYVTVRLVRDGRHADHTLTLSGDADRDCTAAVDALAGLRSVVADSDADPHLLLSTEPRSTRDEREGQLPPTEALIDTILGASGGLDLVGLYAGGPIYRGFANSLGQRNWHAATTFNLSWSLYHRADKAVKASYAGFAWDSAAFRERMTQARERLALVARTSRSLEPGKYRAYLAPSAMEEVLDLLGWGAFSGRAIATRQSPLQRLHAGERLDPRVTLTEDVAGGVAPPFQPEGFVRPGRVPLVDKGAWAGALVSPRTAQEFGLEANGATGWESPDSLSMEGGDLDEKDALAALGTGLWIGNLHYLNYSDRPACRLTGMTRFATFWVEDGQVVAPVDVLRFDDTLYRLLGSNLVALTSAPEFVLSSASYRSRSLSSLRVPGALVSEMTFTL